MKKYPGINTSFFLITISVFMIFTVPDLFSEGMFLDGTVYATIARNMAEGKGSFWYPYYTETSHNPFHEHPAMGIRMLSFGFSLFGDSIYVERFYSLLTFILTALIVLRIWKELTGETKSGWIPFLFWLMLPIVSWCYANNMLENTLSVFISLSVYLYLVSKKQFRYLFLILSGLSLFMGLLTKGFTALFPWSLPFWYWLFIRERKFQSMLFESAVMILLTLLPVFLLYAFSDAAADSMNKYLNLQVVKSLKHIQTVNSRLYITGRFFLEISIDLVIALPFILFSPVRNSFGAILKNRSRVFMLFLCLSLSGTLPVMISMKQSHFYIFAVYPFFALALAYILKPFIDTILVRLSERPLFKRILGIAAILSILIILILSGFQFNRIERNRDRIEDTKSIVEHIGENQILSACEKLRTDWPMKAYLARYGHISLDYNHANLHDYYLLDNSCDPSLIAPEYVKLNLPLQKYALYKAINARESTDPED